jgi:hypothetical protein
VLLCFLAPLLIRMDETRTGAAWTTVREALQDLHVGVATGPAGTFTSPTPSPDGPRRAGRLEVETAGEDPGPVPADTEPTEQRADSPRPVPGSYLASW